jgi:cytoplasmic iron level regulating protein YaaA (DUF328/UPF0246 family)
MKVLLAPSEKKTKGGSEEFFSSFFEIQKEAIEKFDTFLQTNTDTKNFCKDKTPILKRKAKKAILRYSGVAFSHLDYESLDDASKEWLDENLLIFSNLFGILKANDKIPYYTLKQGKKPGFDIYTYYKEKIPLVLDEIEEFIDLRAKFYEKIYKPKNAITFKFIKDNKVVSHFAKAYRGLLTRYLAIYKPKTLDDVLKIVFPFIKVTEIIEKKSLKEIVCEVSGYE